MRSTSSVQRGGKRNQHRIVRHAANYGVELLERRWLFASIVVNTTADNAIAGDGLTTLREAITAANSDPAPDAITFSLNGSFPAISLSGSLPDLSSTMTIQGPAGDLLTVYGSGSDRIFNVVAGTVGLSRMNIRYGHVDGEFEGGGGIRVGTGRPPPSKPASFKTIMPNGVAEASLLTPAARLTSVTAAFFRTAPASWAARCSPRMGCSI